MTILSPPSRIALAVALVTGTLVLTACQSAPVHNDAVSAARAELTTLQADPDLSSRAPAAIKDAETAVQAAEAPQSDADATAHLAYIAGNKVKEAHAIASTRLAEDQLKASAGQGQKIQLEARTQEADKAILKAEGADRRADAAEGKATQAEQQAALARQQTDFSGQQANAAAQHVSALEKELADLHAKKTDRGMVFTLGDVLFATGKSDLQMGTIANLDRLTDALQKEPGRHVTIEGHTDNVGNTESNMALSQRRADAVKTYLVGRGLSLGRISAVGKGEAAPVMGNETSVGRQKNRRVEVIIENASAAVSGAMSN